MCGRYSFVVEDALIWERFGIRVRTAVYKAVYNCAPSQDLPVITSERGGSLEFLRWGLVPFWAKDPSVGARMINARAETVMEKPSFRNAFRDRRCLVPADSFYEWERQGRKIPFRILMKSRMPFVMAGIWDQWKKRDGTILRSFSILTTRANELIAPLHDRMPVILQPEAAHQWLSRGNETDLLRLLVPCQAEEMEMYPVSKLVNSPLNNDPRIHEPMLEDPEIAL
jgi:putative SOS response-associated peptidase YedK